ncbi:MAG: 4a-hydroxytetrahydrobiopterin dehydratase [Actinomycetota bacterium]|nr:4a-hydroxytetrahydrobiopterin dehydratase [Actinomycetota bacterium]
MTEEQTGRDPKQILTGDDVEAEDLSDWRIMHNTLQARYRTGSFATGLAMVTEIGQAAEEMNHHPDLDLRYPTLHVRLSSHDVGGVTQRDIDLARRISEMAGPLGAQADPGAVQVLELGLDTPDHAAIMPFWVAVLGMEPSPGHDDEIVDNSGILPTIWFQETDPHDEPRQRFHLDIRVPPEVAEARVKAALDAGGTLVSDKRAPAYWVLADVQGNKACVCTWKGRV